VTERRQFCPQGHDTFVVGRDSSYRCLECKRLDSQASRAAREASAQAARTAELVRGQAEADRRRAHERELALAAGGTVAREARWLELWDQTLEGTGSRYGLCQWPQSDDRPGGCMRRTQGVYCAKHNRQLERGTEQRRQEERQARPDPSRMAARTPDDSRNEASRHRQKGE
jgi:hypothetical protein